MHARRIGIIGIGNPSITKHLAMIDRINSDFEVLTAGMDESKIKRLHGSIETASAMLRIRADKIKQDLITASRSIAPAFERANEAVLNFGIQAATFHDIPDLAMSTKTRNRLERQRSGKNSHRNHFAKRGRS